MNNIEKDFDFYSVGKKTLSNEEINRKNKIETIKFFTKKFQFVMYILLTMGFHYQYTIPFLQNSSIESNYVDENNVLKINPRILNDSELENKYIENYYGKLFNENKNDINLFLPILLEYSQENVNTKLKTLEWIESHIINNNYLKSEKTTEVLNQNQLNQIKKIIYSNFKSNDRYNQNKKEIDEIIKLKIFILSNSEYLKEYTSIKENTIFKKIFFDKYKEKIMSIEYKN